MELAPELISAFITNGPWAVLVLILIVVMIRDRATMAQKYDELVKSIMDVIRSNTEAMTGLKEAFPALCDRIDRR